MFRRSETPSIKYQQPSFRFWPSARRTAITSWHRTTVSSLCMWIPLRMHWWTCCIVSPQASHTKAFQLSAKCKTSCMSIKSRLLLSCTICKTYFLPALCSHLTPQQSTPHQCAKLEATHWNNFTGGVWLYFQTSLDWLAFVPLACVRCFAATLAPPPSSGPHLHPSTRLADLLIHAINYVRLLVCEFWLKVFPNSGSNLRFFFFLLVFLFFFNTPWLPQRAVKSSLSVNWKLVAYVYSKKKRKKRSGEG